MNTFRALALAALAAASFAAVAQPTLANGSCDTLGAEFSDALRIHDTDSFRDASAARVNLQLTLAADGTVVGATVADKTTNERIARWSARAVQKCRFNGAAQAVGFVLASRW